MFTHIDETVNDDSKTERMHFSLFCLMFAMKSADIDNVKPFAGNHESIPFNLLLLTRE